MADLAHAFFWGAVSVGSLFLLVWMIHIPLKNAAVVDVGWGIGFIVLCVVYILLGKGFNLRNTICLGMVLLWGIRIVLHLIKRISVEKAEDKRYKKIRDGFGKMAWLKFLMIFEFQAVLEMIIGIPLIVISFNPNPGLSFFEMSGILIFIIALAGETVSDEQLRIFKKDAMNKGKVCNTGLWRYSRHPNYFFEWLLWVGLFVYALGSPMGWAAVISPVTMYCLLMYVSGVPMAEEQSLLSRKDEYRKYQETTSIFFPMIPGKTLQ